jgi:hypothetical protein
LDNGECDVKVCSISCLNIRIANEAYGVRLSCEPVIAIVKKTENVQSASLSWKFHLFGFIPLLPLAQFCILRREILRYVV